MSIFQTPLLWSLWSGHHWRDLFFPQNLRIDDASFGQSCWNQNCIKGQHLSRPVIASTGISQLTKKSFHPNFAEFLAFFNLLWVRTKGLIFWLCNYNYFDFNIEVPSSWQLMYESKLTRTNQWLLTTFFSQYHHV